VECILPTCLFYLRLLHFQWLWIHSSWEPFPSNSLRYQLVVVVVVVVELVEVNSKRPFDIHRKNTLLFFLSKPAFFVKYAGVHEMKLEMKKQKDERDSQNKIIQDRHYRV
jgi:hypothetical protein